MNHIRSELDQMAQRMFSGCPRRGVASEDLANRRSKLRRQGGLIHTVSPKGYSGLEPQLSSAQLRYERGSFVGERENPGEARCQVHSDEGLADGADHAGPWCWTAARRGRRGLGATRCGRDLRNSDCARDAMKSLDRQGATTGILPALRTVSGTLPRQQLQPCSSP